MTRIVIAGVPRAGKTTLANKLGESPLDGPLTRICSTDDLLPMEWSALSEAVSLWFDDPGPWVVEGVATVRALRKWLCRETGKPCDLVVWRDHPFERLTPAQRRMAVGARRIWREIRPVLRRRGVACTIDQGGQA